MISEEKPSNLSPTQIREEKEDFRCQFHHDYTKKLDRFLAYHISGAFLKLGVRSKCPRIIVTFKN